VFETLSESLYKNAERHIYLDHFRICRAINELSDAITTQRHDRRYGNMATDRIICFGLIQCQYNKL